MGFTRKFWQAGRFTTNKSFKNSLEELYHWGTFQPTNCAMFSKAVVLLKACTLSLLLLKENTLDGII